MLDVTIARASLPTSGALLLPVEEGAGGKAAAWAGLDAATGGAVSRALEAAEFKGKKGQTATILAPGAGISRVVAVGIGKLAELTPLAAEEAGGNGIALLGREAAAAIAADMLSAEQAAHLAHGAVLRSYRFDRYRTTEKPEDRPRLSAVTLLVADPDAAEKAWEPLPAIAKGVFLTRDLVSEPPNVLTPPEFADRIEALEKLGLKIEVFGQKEMAKLGFGALLGVSQGSAQEPRMVVMQWHGAGDHKGKGKKGTKAKPVAFVGKGVTFDTGGISIKPAAGMEDMKWDMAGAGTVVGLMAALAGRKAKVDAVGLVGLVENMPSGTAQRPGDVVKTYSGQTVEIINTDAEGRMVLADVLWYCQEKFEPRFMVDLATLTGAMVITLGHEIGGFFSNDDTLAQQLHAAGEASGEKLWRMPLGEAYDKQLKSDIADMKHVGGRPGGAITAAQFLQRFVNGKPWAHLDIAGMAWSSKDSATVPKGATAYGVRLLDTLVAQNFEGSGLAEVGFYHLTRTGPDTALPKLLGRTLAAGQRAAVVCGSEERVAALDAALWLSPDPDWLPHGTRSVGQADLQPIWLATDDAAPNGARFLFLLDGAETFRADAFDRVFDLFDGRDEAAVAAARKRWTAAKQAGHALTYWQQSPRGWERKG